ncbi:hypothetical protein HAHE_13110 [Haloferula helveola]|uniref:Uncharacterized protein n=1 Tax=Haloferula helveola TaxID=490095 RepID=A0ABN6H1K6_9BACT|nr:hypothetical protein HAHE_13110 [Haloferula helveola]
MRTILFLFLLTVPSLAQWRNVAYPLKGGWNAIYLYGDASHTTPDGLFASGDGLQIEEVWRWNPNPSQVQFTSDPFNPTPGTPEWSTWYRTPPGGVEGSLAALDGQAAYLVKCTGSSSNNYTVTIPQRILPPRASWVRNGANLLGFPVVASPSPTFSNYFDTFPAAIAAGSEIYRYAGGPLGAGNPLQLFDPTIEGLKRGQAYWFEAQVSGTFYAPLEVTASHPDGLAFGRTGSVITVRVRNRSNSAVTLTVSPESSDAPPVGTIAGPVPLTLIEFDPGTGGDVATQFAAAQAFAIGPQATLQLRFGLDRGAMTGASSEVYGSLLRFTETGLTGGPLMDLSLPVSAQVASLAGLWLGEVEVDGVQSLVPTSPGGSVARPFPLRFLMHVDDAGVARILSQVFVGPLAGSNDLGVTTSEVLLDASKLAAARRYSAVHLPPGRVIDGTGTVGLGGSLVATTDIGFNDPTNPFVHRFHPDHNNRDERDNTGLPEGRESYTIGREMSFTFASTPPAGVGSIGWGSTVLAGTYGESLTGVFRQGGSDSLTTGGSFLFRRINEIGTLTTP